MPTLDTDPIFVTGSVSNLGDLAVSDRGQSLKWLTKTMPTVNPGPFVVYIAPRSGYAERLTKRIELLDVMARVTKLLRSEHKYLPASGIAVRNLVWSECMTQVIVNALVSALPLGRIDKVEILLDEKTLAPETRQLLVDQVRASHQTLRSIALGIGETNPQAAQILQRRLAFNKEDITIHWSDEIKLIDEARFGLHLADRLATLARRSVQRRKREAFESRFAYSPVTRTGIFLDATDLVARPLHDDAVARWSRNTGLSPPGQTNPRS